MLAVDKLDDFPPEPCRTPNCPDAKARYGEFCGGCLALRSERYSELVPIGAEIIITIQDGMVLRTVPGKK